MKSVAVSSVLVKERAPEVEEGVWIFVLADMCMFALIFISYMVERAGQPELYVQSQAELNQTLGMLNTMVLLVSSWFVALSVKALRRDDNTSAARYFVFAFLCGVLFIVNKFVEYGEKLDAGITILSNDFFMFYYIVTGIHLAHVIGGMIVLVVAVLNIRSGKYSSRNMSFVEGGGIYWHMVDLLWVLIFPLIYFLQG